MRPLFSELFSHECIARPQQQLRVGLPPPVQLGSNCQVVIQHYVGTVLTRTAVVVHNQEPATCLFKSLLIVFAEPVSVYHCPSCSRLRVQIAHACRIPVARYATYELNAESFRSQSMLQGTRSLGHRENDGSAVILPCLGQRQAARDVTHTDFRIRVCAYYERLSHGWQAKKDGSLFCEEIVISVLRIYDSPFAVDFLMFRIRVKSQPAGFGELNHLRRICVKEPGGIQDDPLVTENSLRRSPARGCAAIPDRQIMARPRPESRA